MRDVRVPKDELVAILTKNREAHREIFLEAVEGYRKRVVEILEDHLARVKAGKLERVSISLPEPADHTRDYDRALGMLEMSVDEEVLIDEQRYSELVMDDWGWKNQFLTTNSAYSASALATLKG